jgi:branched-chain amino acid transport system permease protein
MFSQFGPTVGAIITLVLAELLRTGIGTDAVGLDNAIYGIALVLFIIFLPKGIVGGTSDLVQRMVGGGKRSSVPAE